MTSAIGVSIIIDSYNQEKFVTSTIESALAQDHSLVQIIVIDDGSTDRTQEMIGSFGHRVETIFQENQGQVTAISNALPRTIHDIVIVLDGDDLLDQNTASSVVAAWRKGVSKVQYSLRVIDENGVFNGDFFPKYSSRMSPEMIRAEVFRTGSYPDSPTSGNAFDRRFLEITLPLTKQRHSFDGELNGLAPLYGDVITINEPLGCYRIHGHNDYALKSLVVEKFKSYVHRCEDKVAFLRKHYLAKGQTIDDHVLDNDLKYLEYRLVVEKLSQPSADRGQKLRNIAQLGMRAAWNSPFMLMPKLLRMTWIVMISLAPTGLATALIEQRFIPSLRWGWITWLATLRSGGNGAGSAGPEQVFGKG